jgi:ATP-dependent Clp protease ATP-binding subunit ClpA
MKVTIPIYIEQQQQQEQSVSRYIVRPLFFAEPVSRDEELQRAVSRFVKAMRRTLNDAGKQMWHGDLSSYSFAPTLDDQLLSFNLDLKTRRIACKFLFVTFNSLNRRIAFSPNLPDLWFEIERGETLESRAAEVLTQHFRGKGKRKDPYLPKPEDFAVAGKAWASTVEIEFDPPLVAKTPREVWRAHLGGAEVLDGEEELQQVGRCLDWLYPDELNRVVARDREVEELTRLLKAADRRPVLLLGPRMAGKTALVEEYVYRTVAKRKSQFKNKNNVWLIAPQRLISGMSYVGQWENRLIAILKEAKKRSHILYFDDLIGLFKAGLSRDASLSVASVMKPYIERRDLRVLGEITPEAWRVLREQDRGLADMFHILPVEEPGEDETIEMLLGLVRQLESQHHCIFSLDALPAVIDLQRRYVRDAAFPGKAAAFLRQMAIKHRGSSIGRQQVIEEFQAKSGLAWWMLVETEKLRRFDVIERLQRSVFGQKAALEACADALCVAEARLNDPDRPLASFLFLGPTGVGKTQCAKELAAMLFGSEERLVRFDMNEFNSFDAVARLVGTFDQPEGLLTSAVRRQPFSIILLDEIEKAHRDVFNLLLQVMGDGRLTDALGRTADFTNTILILTSNLGVKEANEQIGFQSQPAAASSIYVQAAEKFFSPEFFNRLDRIVPFARLDRRIIERIAYGLIHQIFTREGLVRRKTVLRIDERALERVIDAGFHPQLGARALKRAIEKQLTQPLAARLSIMSGAAPAVVDILPGRDRLQVKTQELIEAEPQETSPITALPDDPQLTLESIEEFISRIEEDIAVMRPEGAISIDAVEPRHFRYFTLKERLRSLRSRCDWLRRQYESAARASSRLGAGYPRVPRMRDRSAAMHRDTVSKQVLKQIFAAEDIHAYLREMASQTKREDSELREQLADAVYEAAMMEMLAQNEREESEHRALILLRSHNTKSADDRDRLKRSYRELFTAQFGLEAKPLTADRNFHRRADDWLLLSGRNALRLARTEMGTHLYFDQFERMGIVQVIVFPLEVGVMPRTAIAGQIRSRKRWIEKLAQNEARADDDPHPLDPVIRIYSESASQRTTVDLRSGMTVPRYPTMDDFRAFLASSLELPVELQS